MNRSALKNAREKRPGGRNVSAEEIGPAIEPFQRPLICEFRDGAVVPVRGYKTVPNLFRLAQNAAHAPDCALNPTAARGAHGLAHVTEQGILRLELPPDISTTPPPPGTPEGPPHDEIHERHTSTVTNEPRRGGLEGKWP